MNVKFRTPRYTPSAPSIQRHFNGATFPESWARHHLVDLIDSKAPICYGILMPGAHVPDGVPVIKVKDYVRGPIQADSVLRTSPEIDQQYRRSRVKAGDILMSIRGGTGDLAVVPMSLEGANITQDSARLRVKGAADSSYLLWVLRSAFVQSQIALDTIGQAVTGINIASVRNLVIPVPPLPEQRKIADILTTWDDALEKLDAFIAAKDRRKKALMQRVLTGRKRLPGFDNSQGKTEVDKFGVWPADWSHVHLGDIAREVSHRNKNGDELPVLSCTKHRGLVRSEEYFGKRVFAEDTSGYRVVRRGEFAYATNHIEEGSIGYQDLCDTGLVSPIYTVFKTKPGVLDRYLFRVLKSPLLIHLYRIMTSSSVNRRGSLRYKEFAKIKIWLPSKEEQTAIADLLDTCDAELTLLRRQRDALDLQKRGLMQRLLTGKIRVTPTPKANV